MYQLSERRGKAHSMRQNFRKSFISDNEQIANFFSERGTPNKTHQKSQQQFRHQPLPISYFFDKNQRKNIIRKVIDNYMQPQKNPEVPVIKVRRKVVSTRSCYTSENKRRVPIKEQISFSNSLPLKKINDFSFDYNNKSLPIIQQNFPQRSQIRPQSQGHTPISADFDLSPIIRKRRSLIRNQQIKKSSKMNNQSSLSILIQGSNTSFMSQNSSIVSDKIPEVLKQKQCKYFSYKKITQPINTQILIAKQFTKQGRQQYFKQLRIRDIGGKVLWRKSDLHKDTLIYKNKKSLLNQLMYKIKRIHGNETVYKINPLQTYYRLFVNKNQQLVDIIVQIAKQLIHLKGKIITNGIYMGNIYRIEEKQIYFGDWTNAAIREQIVTKSGTVNKYYDPLLKQDQEWICKYEYLAPQIIVWARDGFKNKSIWENYVNSSDIWALGCMILELLTLIPLGANQRYSVKDRTYFRKGLLSMQKYSNDQFLRKQKLFLQHYLRQTKKQIEGVQVEQKVWIVLEGMLKYKRQERITPEEIIRILTK